MTLITLMILMTLVILDSPQASVPKILRLSNSSLATVDADEVQDDINSISSQSSTTSDVVTPALRVRTRGGLSCRGGRGGFCTRGGVRTCNEDSEPTGSEPTGSELETSSEASMPM